MVVSDGESFDGFYFLQGVLNVGEEYATGVANMVERVLALAKSGDTIIALTIHGHGNDSGQYAVRTGFRLQRFRCTGKA